MADSLNPSRRSENMRRIKAGDTKPEMAVRKLLHSLGYRYRLHAKELPGKPDVVFRSRKKVILVHGCFWHQCQTCREGRPPGTRTDYWIPKLTRNKERDISQAAQLARLGWKQFVVWECEIRNLEKLKERLLAFLNTD
jgi:DNA mismatch endonuclease (patch repair protein)